MIWCSWACFMSVTGRGVSSTCLSLGILILCCPEHGLAAGRAASTPMDHKEMLLTTKINSKKEHQLLSSYPAMIGSIRYIVNSSRSDLCYAAAWLPD
jgi:hypothetical protein